MLSATRRRVIPASVALTGALAAGLVGAAAPAQAAPATSAGVTTAVAATTTPTLTSAQRAAAARKAAAVAAAKKRAKAVSIARSKLGSRYRAGRSGPRAFDCSGFALYVVRAATGRTLPHYSKAQFRATKRVAKSKLQPGDLVFFFKHGAHHSGVYIGHGKMISATNPRHGVKVDSVFSGWYGQRYSGAGRLV